MTISCDGGSGWGEGSGGGIPGTGAQRPERAVVSRAYFRCDRLSATLSVEQCRANRARMTPQQMLALPYEVPGWWVQPLPCWSCSLAAVVEAGSVAFYTAEQVLAGAVPATAASAWNPTPLRPDGAPAPGPTVTGSASPGVGRN